MRYRWPLMNDCLEAEDREAVITLLKEESHFTMGKQVEAFEREFCAWQGCKHAVMVNSGASANLITMAALGERCGNWKFKSSKLQPKVVVPVLTWSSDIASVIHAGFEPVFVDVDRRTLGSATVHGDCAANFITHCMGFNALPHLEGKVTGCFTRLVEDCCESIGATYKDGSKIGTKGLAANFSFYYAHHMTTIEGGMVTTDDRDFADLCRMLRNHGLTRGVEFAGRPDDDMDLDPNFTFAVPGFNVRPTEIAAAIGRSQLKRLDANIVTRQSNLALWLTELDGKKYQTDFELAGASPYGLVLVLNEPDEKLKRQVEGMLLEQGVEYRRGVCGGGNQLRQPYLRRSYGDLYKQFPVAEHLHHHGWAIGNWPDFDHGWIKSLAMELNKL